MADRDAGLASRVPGYGITRIHYSGLVAMALPAPGRSSSYHECRAGINSGQPSTASRARRKAGAMDADAGDFRGLGLDHRTISQRLCMVVLRVLAAEILIRPARIQSW